MPYRQNGQSCRAGLQLTRHDSRRAQRADAGPAPWHIGEQARCRADGFLVVFEPLKCYCRRAIASVCSHDRPNIESIIIGDVGMRCAAWIFDVTAILGVFVHGVHKCTHSPIYSKPHRWHHPWTDAPPTSTRSVATFWFLYHGKWSSIGSA